jgi:predicted RNase H-like nuclease
VSNWRVLGVDAYKAGWIGIVLSHGTVSAYVAAGIGDLVEDACSGGPLSVIAIDIPIGLPDQGRHQADLLVRKAVGPRRASVFMTPVRPALEAADYASATASQARASHVKRSPCRPRSARSTAGVRQTRHRVVEVHPEASFAKLAGTHAFP